MIKIVLPSALALAVLATALALRPRQTRSVSYEPVPVMRGDVSDVLRETGTIATRDPVLVKAGIEGDLEWIIEDGEWVQAGDRLFVVNDDEALRTITEMRSTLLNARQALALARLRREHAQRVEQQKVEASRRAFDSARMAHRILSTPPTGGTRLIELHEQLAPLEAQTARVRADYEKAQAAYQAAQDAYLERLDQWQEQKDLLLRAQTTIDELAVRAEADADPAKPEESKARDEAALELAEQRRQMTQRRAGLPAFEETLNEARAARDAARGPRDQRLRKLEERDESERELHIQVEIEKRGVELAQLQIDRQINQLELAEARRKFRDGRSAFDSGAISQVELEKLESHVTVTTKELDILDEKIKIAARPAPPEQITEVRLKMEQAQVNLSTAEAVRDRNVNVLDQEIAVFEAESDRLQHEIDQKALQFSTVIEANIQFLERELEGLDSDETVRRRQIKQGLVDLAASLKHARAQPPNVGHSPADGAVKLARRWGRTYHAGDEVEQWTVLMEINPALNLEVHTALNEANVRQVRQGMAAHITVPALGGREMTGTVSLVGGVGKDKYHDLGDRSERAFADVTQFKTRIRLEDVPQELRPGMTVVIAIEAARLENVLHLPLGAVRIRDGAAFVLARQNDKPRERAIEGRLFGDDAFVVESGLREGDMVWIERRRSR